MNPTSPAPFDHRDRGTAEEAWTTALRDADHDTLDLSQFSRLVVLAAHPDDETLMCGGLLATAGSGDLTVDVIVATDGDASHPDSPTHTPRDLAEARVRETTDAVGLLAPQTRLRFLHLPDGGTQEQVEAMTTAVVEAAAAGTTGADRCLLVSTWRDDRHPDHRAAALAASAAAWRTDAVHLEAPLWFWHWGSPKDLPALADTGRLTTLPLSADIRATKQDAVGIHTTQVRALGPEPGNEALLGPHVLAHFGRDTEYFVRTAADTTSPFDDLHRGDDDPWATRTSWYEERKRAQTLSALPHRRAGTALEIGCSVGTLAEALADRCDHVLAVDDSAAALAVARRRVRNPAVEFRQCRVPEQWPDIGDSPDLVVLSETGYFLSPERMRRLARRIADSGAPVVLACHWRHPVVGWPLDATAVHAVLDEILDLPVSVRIVDADAEIVVWSAHTGGGHR